MKSSSYFSILLLFIVLNFSSVIAGYIWSNCNSALNFTSGSTYSTNLDQVITDLFSSTSLTSGFNTSTAGQPPNRVYGLMQCIANVSTPKCSDCGQQAYNSLQERCGNNVGGRVFMDECFLGYDNINFISTLDTQLYISLFNRNNVSSNNKDEFNATTSSLLANLSKIAAQSVDKRYAIGSASYSTSKYVYGLAQCWRYLSSEDCTACLANARSQVEGSVKQGADILLASCTLRFETSPFFDTTDASPPAATTSPPTATISPPPGKGKSSKILPIVLGVVGAVIMVFGVCLIAMRKRKRSSTIGTTVAHDEEMEAYSAESGLLVHEHQHFIMSLESLAEATQNFDEDNKLGEGGFGPVYRGTTRDGKEIAVKKLSARSNQGKREFMNEVKLMANIQHRNLVKLLGCCADGDERLLVYEYFPNKSLDNFLFHPEKRKLLDWEKRSNIIIGIVRGLLYLHEDSQMKIIHRDIKANNILLDDKLNPKIADFGLARLFPEDETQIQTRVAGTYGYLAPEYAMRGQLSVKADVYSFGVLLLEILSGRKHTDPSLPDEIQNLLEWAWRLYRGGDVISLAESKVKESWPKERVERCIRVALLCVQADATNRPTMSNVIMMISSNAVGLPNPTKPASAFVSVSESTGGLEYENDTSVMTSSQASGTTGSSLSGVPSVNETSVTGVGPR